MPKIFDPFKLSSAVRPQYWARRQRWASTELVISTVCTMTSSGQAAHSISQTLTKTLAFHSSLKSDSSGRAISRRAWRRSQWPATSQRIAWQICIANQQFSFLEMRSRSNVENRTDNSALTRNARLMSQEKKEVPPDLNLQALALAALEEARAVPPGPERTEAMKKAGMLRNAAALRGMFFAKRGRPPK